MSEQASEPIPASEQISEQPQDAPQDAPQDTPQDAPQQQDVAPEDLQVPPPNTDGPGAQEDSPSDEAQAKEYLENDPHTFNPFTGKLLDVVRFCIQDLHQRVDALEGKQA